MLEAYGLSDPGCVRSNNEDYFISDSRSGIFILADGMGGANAGEYASRLSAEMLYEFLLNVPPDGNLESLEHGFLEANWAVRHAATANPELEGMGTTLLAVIALDENRLQIGSVGDSRAYLLAGQELSLITQDQTWVAEVGSRLGLTDEALKSTRCGMSSPWPSARQKSCALCAGSSTSGRVTRPYSAPMDCMAYWTKISCAKPWIPRNLCRKNATTWSTPQKKVVDRITSPWC